MITGPDQGHASAIKIDKKLVIKIKVIKEKENNGKKNNKI